MSFMDDLKRWAKGDEEEYEDELEEFTPEKRPAKTEADNGVSVTDFRRSANNKVVNINSVVCCAGKARKVRAGCRCSRPSS